MNKDALDFIAAIASNMREVNKPLADIRDTLTDGEALMHLGADDSDQPMIEEAHSIVTGWMEAGHRSYEEAAVSNKPK